MATTREEILEQVKGALSEKLGIDESEITEDASFEEDLGADSLDLVEVVMDLEDQFGLKIPDEDARELTTVGKAIDYVIGHSAGLHELGRLIEELPADRLEQVFTHASWAEDRAESYERLEFPGDSVLELAIARAVFDRFAAASEGRLAKIRAHVVSRQSCAAVAKELGLGEQLLGYAGSVPKDE